MPKYGVFSGPYFLVFGLNTDIYFVYSLRIQENTDQKKLRIWTFFTQCLRDKLLNKGINILGAQHHCLKYIKPIVHCFKWQQFGHISKYCTNKSNFCNYFKSHPTHLIFINNSFCVNWKIAGHPSTSKDCPKCIERKYFFQNEVPTVQHFLF